jgi:hypothetical protein
MAEPAPPATPATPEAPANPAAEPSTPATTIPQVGNLLEEASAGAPAEGDPATAEPSAPQGAPESYADFTLPEGVTLPDETLAAFRDFAKEKNLTQDSAQELLAFGTTQLRAAAEAPYRLWAETQKAWQQELAADPEIGGAWGSKEAPGKAQIAANKAIETLAGDAAGATALRQALVATGAGNNPAIVKAFIRMGQMLAEPGFVRGAAPAEEPKSTAKMLYPNMN